jgi:hypothetical protein
VALTTQPLPGLGGPTSNEKNFPTITITPFPSNLLSSPATTMANSYSEEGDRIISALEAYRSKKKIRKLLVLARENCVYNLCARQQICPLADSLHP